MSNVRNYFKAREKRQAETQNVNYKERIRGHRLVVFYRILLGILLVAAIAFLAYTQWRNKIYTSSLQVSSSAVSITQGTNVEELGGNILLYSKDGASCLDSKGNAVWNQTYEMQNPILSICESVAAIGDYNGRTIYVMDKSGSMGVIDTNMPIRDFCVASNGVVATILDDVDITWIYIFDAEGNTLVQFKTTMEKSGYPVSISISPNGKLFGISYLYVDSGEMKSSVAYYNFGSVGQNEIDNYVSGYDYLDTVVPYIQFLNASSAFAVSDDRIMFYHGSEKPTSIKECLLSESVQSVFYNDSYVGLVFNNTNGDTAYRLDVYNTEGNIAQSVNFDIEYTDIIFHRDQIIIYNDKECLVYNASGITKYAGEFAKSTSLVIPTSSLYRYVVVTADTIDTLELQ